MSTWLDAQDQDQVGSALASLRAKPGDALRYAGGDERFGLWLALADTRCSRLVGVGIFDLADWTWRDAYDAGMSPREAVIDALSEDDTFGPHLDELGIGQ